MHATEKTVQCCRLCKSLRIKSVLEKDGLYIFKCFDCKIVFLGNELDEKSIKDLYRYYAHGTFSDHISPVTRLRYRKLLDSFERYRKHNSIIDVGCGAGYFMSAASDKRWDVEGTEISDDAIKLVKQKRQRVIKGDIASLDLQESKYDIATLFELIEHAVNPEGIIEKLSYILRPGGLVYITTPNYNNIMRRLLGDRWEIFHKEHLFYFTPRDLSQLLNKHGFRIKKIKTENLSLREILKIFNRSKPLDTAVVYKKQENLRNLTEKRIVFFAIKKFINFILNIFKIGGTIYIFAEKKKEIT